MVLTFFPEPEISLEGESEQQEDSQEEDHTDKGGMINPIVATIRTALECSWCMTAYCTTCGNHEYRNALRKIGGPLGGTLADALEAIEPREITRLPNWQNAIHVAILTLPISVQVSGVMEAWLSRAYEDVDFTDFILFAIIRRSYPKSSHIRQQWIDECTRMAVETEHFSLTESLLIVLRERAQDLPKLVEIGRRHAMKSEQMRRVLRNCCGIR